MTEISKKGKGINLSNLKIDNFRYWDDPRWGEVKRLRGSGDPTDLKRADELEERIKKHWGAS